MNAQELDLDALFAYAEVVEIIEQEYFSGVERAILGDDEAFKVITASMEMMRFTGDFERLQNMTQYLGQMACDHQHMQDFSKDISTKFSTEAEGMHKKDDGHGHDKSENHDDEDDDEYEWVNGIRKKKRKIKK